jgi:CRISPR/Cas system-associated exonuclease Cas4 (RecB family)
MQIFSPNMLKTFEECSKKYEFRYIQKLSVPQSAKIFEKGKKIHALAHYYLKGDDIEKFIPTLSSEESEIWQRLFNNEYFQKIYVNSEYSLSAKVGDYWIGGRLDAFMRSDKDYFILDYKTGSVPQNPSEDFQTMIYLICADEILKKGWGNDFTLSFVYIDLNNNRNHLINYDSTKRLDYKSKITEECKKITTTRNFSKNQSRCNFCEYSKFCL